MTDGQYGSIQDSFLYSYLFSFLVGGWVIDRLGVRWGMALAITWWSLARIIRRGWPVLRARLAIMFCCACLTAFTFSLGMISSQALIIAVLSLLTFSIMAWIVNICTIPVDVFPEAIVGRVAGLTAAAAILGTMVINKITTHCAESGNYPLLFGFMSLSTLCGFMVVYVLLRHSPLVSGKENETT